MAKKRVLVFLRGAWYPNAHYDDKSVLWIFPKMPSEIFCSKICWQNSAKASFVYQQWTATVLIFLKVPTTDSLVFFSEYISRTAILMQTSVEFLDFLLYWCYMFNLFNFIFQRLIWTMISIHFLWFDYWTLKEWKTAKVQNHSVSAY